MSASNEELEARVKKLEEKVELHHNKFMGFMNDVNTLFRTLIDTLKKGLGGESEDTERSGS